MSFTAWNGPAPTTAGQLSVAVANGVKTMLQLATPADMPIRLVGWGYSLDVAGAGIGEVELLGADVAATVTAHSAAGILNDDPNGPSTRLTLGVSATGFTASVEGTIGVSRVFAARKVPITGAGADLSYDWIWPYGTGPVIAVSKFLRIRTTFTSTTPTMLCYVRFDQL